MPQLCLRLAEADPRELQRKIDLHAGGPSMIEVRLDYLSDPTPPRLPDETSTAFVATCRPVREGGRFEGDETDRLRLLQDAAESGFEWIDLEHDVHDRPPLPERTRIVRSIHHFGSFPLSLDRELSLLEDGDLAKVAVTVRDTNELVILLDWMTNLPSDQARVIIGMGEFGQLSRYLGAYLGNRWTYVGDEDEPTAAPGLLSLEEAEEVYSLNRAESPQRYYGVLGRPIAHSFSPRIHNALFRKYEIPALYVPILASELGPWFRYIQDCPLDFAGFSVTLPFKLAVVEHLGEAPPRTAVNTLYRQNGVWLGENTDYPGFIAPLQGRMRVRGATATVLGNGGVARTAVEALVEAGCQVTAVGRNSDRIVAFARECRCGSALFSDLPIRSDLCVNATPVGQYPDTEDSPVSSDQLNSDLVYDLIYRPRKTRFLRIAAGKGAATLSGLGMFVEQAALQFRLWTGIEPEREFMTEVLEEALED